MTLLAGCEVLANKLLLLKLQTPEYSSLNLIDFIYILLSYKILVGIFPKQVSWLASLALCI